MSEFIQVIIALVYLTRVLIMFGNIFFSISYNIDDY